MNQFELLIQREIFPGAKVLDAGAGQSTLREKFAHANYTSLDSAIGDPNWDYSKLDIIGDITSIPIKDKSLDAVVCLGTLEHVISPERAICEFNRILKTGGMLFLAAPQMVAQHQKPHDYYRFTSFGLRYLLETSGFHIISLKPKGGYFLLLGNELKVLQKLSFLTRNSTFLLPLKILWQIISFPLFRVAIPLVFYWLDALDRDKDFTEGYHSYSRKAMDCNVSPR